MLIDARFTLLIVDDDANVRKSLQQYFKRMPLRVDMAENGRQALDFILANDVDLVLLDLNMPGKDGMSVLQEALAIRPDLNVIILTGYGGVREAVEAIHGGALDFFEKPISLDILQKKIDQVYRLWRLKAENRDLLWPIEGQFHFDNLVGESPAMLALKDLIARVGPTLTSVLIQGESGTGKELVAKAIHHHSKRCANAFIPVDCAAISESVLESELFGHTRGAFTGADQSTPGLIRSADQGSLFFDEAGELPLGVQAKLLRTIQERMVRPVGAVRTIKVDIRIIAATNQDLPRAVAEGRFRLDLYYRLSAVTLHVPPLRERVGDIPLLVTHFLDLLMHEGMPPKRISEASMKVLCAHNWPGNVRELENVLRCAAILAPKEQIRPVDLKSLDAVMHCQPHPGPIAKKSLSDYEREAIRNALDQSAGNRRKAAQLLGMSEATFYRRLKSYRLKAAR